METVKLPDAWHEWTITEKVGQGSFGTVYKAERKIGNETFVSAIKIAEIPGSASETEALRRELESELSVREYFRDIVDNYISEIKTMDVLKGISNVVSVEDYVVEDKQGEIGWIIYIRMEFLQSFPRYKAARKISEQEAIRLGKDICTALSYCEKLNILHRDIKPDNIFVSPLGNFKLGDFGVARRLDKTTATYSAKGTFTYMAPEVFKGKRYGAKADIYSLGMVLYKLMNRNRDPFVEPYKQIVYYKDRDDALRRRMNGEELPAPVEASKKLSEVILKACAYAPEDRFANADEMLAALNNLGDEENPPLAELEKHEPEKQESAVVGDQKDKNSRKHRIWPWVVTLLAVAALVTGVVSLKIRDSRQDQDTLPDQDELSWATAEQKGVATGASYEAETDTDVYAYENESNTEQLEFSEQEKMYPSMEEAVKEARQLMEQYWNYVGTDLNAFASLYHNTDMERILNDYSDDDITEVYNSVLFVPVISYNNFYFIDVVYYVVAGEYPDDVMESQFYEMQISYVDGEWKWDYSQEANDAIEKAMKNNPDLYPDGYIEACEEGRNAVVFSDYDYLYLDLSAVYDECFYADVKFAWQDENGNIIAVLCIDNGTAYNHSIRALNLIITDEELGEVVNVSDMEVYAAVEGMCNRLYEVRIPADQVKTGVEAWGNLSVTIDTASK